MGRISKVSGPWRLPIIHFNTGNFPSLQLWFPNKLGNLLAICPVRELVLTLLCSEAHTSLMNHIIKGCKDNAEMKSLQSHMKSAKMNSIIFWRLKNKLEMRRSLIQEDFQFSLNVNTQLSAEDGVTPSCLGKAAWILLPCWSLAAYTLQEVRTLLPFTLSHVLVSNSHNILIKFGLVFLSHLTLCIKGEALHMPPGWGPCNSSIPKAGCFARQGERQLNQSRGNLQLSLWEASRRDSCT